MKAFRSIKTQAASLVFLITFVGLVLLANAGFFHRRDAVRSAEALTSKQAESLSDVLKQVEWGAQTALNALAVTQEVRSLSPEGCSRLFKSYLEASPQYQTLQALLPDGTVFASGYPVPRSLSLADRRYFQDAVRTKAFSPGEYVIGKISKKPSMNFALPVLDQKQQVVAVLHLGINLEWIDRMLAADGEFRNAAVVVSDHRGVVIVARGDDVFASGKPEDPEVFGRTHGTEQSGIFRMTDRFGRDCFIAFEQLRRPGAKEPHLVLRLAVPQKDLLAPVNRFFLTNVLLMVAAALATLLYARRVVIRRIIAPLDSLVDAARGMASGRLDQRVQPAGCAELAELGVSFNRMSEAVLSRETALNETLANLDQARRSALEERRKVEAIFAAIGDGISVQDKEFRVLYQNDIHRSLIGNHEGELCYQAYEGFDAVCPGCPLAMAYEDGAVHRGERSVARAGGALYVEIAASPIRDADGSVAAGIEVVRDITGRKAMQIGLERANAQFLALTEKLEHSNAELQQFAYIASHDLQEPLRTVTSFAQLLASRYRGKLGSDADDFLEYITDGCTRMRRLINDLLLYSRVESKGKELAAVDAGNAVREALANLHAAIELCEANVSCAALPLVMADRQQLVQLFQNLIGNAIKFRGDAMPAIKVECSIVQDEATFSIRDNGIGIAEDAVERIFEPFQRLHGTGTYEGTGMGLAICKKIVLRHGGRIWVESIPGVGSAFCFTLHMAQCAPQEEAKENSHE